MIDVKIKRLSNSATMPTYGSENAACMDLYADLGIKAIRQPNTFSRTIHPHKTVKIGCGFAFQPPSGYCGLIFARSGLATKNGLAPANKVGVADEDYRGEYIIALHNHTDKTQIIHHGDRIAQLMFVPYEQANLIEVAHLDDTTRGGNGFGSTGT